MLHVTDSFKALNVTMSSQIVEQVPCEYRLFYKSGILNWGLPLSMLGLLSWSATETASCPHQYPFSPSSLMSRTQIGWEWQYVQRAAYISLHSFLIDCGHIFKIWPPRCKQKCCLDFPEIHFKTEECLCVPFFHLLAGSGSWSLEVLESSRWGRKIRAAVLASSVRLPYWLCSACKWTTVI